jgi:hypothetical protein
MALLHRLSPPFDPTVYCVPIVHDDDIIVPRRLFAPTSGNLMMVASLKSLVLRLEMYYHQHRHQSDHYYSHFA